MARPRKNISIQDAIMKQEEVVAKAKEKYETEINKLKELYAKRDEEKKEELFEAVEKSGKSYEEIMAYLRGKE